MEEAKEGVKIAVWTLNNLGCHNIDGRKKSRSDKADKKAEERKRKGGPIFQHKEDKDYDNSQ